jgi:hypothetical protein
MRRKSFGRPEDAIQRAIFQHLKARNPEMAAELGIEAPKDAKAEKPADLKSEAPVVNDKGELDPVLAEKIQNHPQVRDFIAAERETAVAQSQQAREQYSNSLQAGQQMLQATVAALAPQLQGMPLEHWPQAIQMLAQVDPVRAELVADTLSKWGSLQQAQQQEAQHWAYVQNQQFEAQRQQYSKASDEALGMTTSEKVEMPEELVAYVGEYGVTREQLVHEAKTNLALNHPAFQKMAADALKYQRMQKTTLPRATKNLPPVQKPGISAPRGEAEHADMQALDARLSKTGNVKDAEKLLFARLARSR